MEHPFGLPTVFPLSSCPSETDLSIQLWGPVGGREADKQLYSAVMTTDGPPICEASVTAFVLGKATCFSWVPQAFVHWRKNQSFKNLNLVIYNNFIIIYWANFYFISFNSLHYICKLPIYINTYSNVISLKKIIQNLFSSKRKIIEKLIS